MTSDLVEQQLNLLHFSASVNHAHSGCYLRVQKQIEQEKQPLFCRNITNFKQKYSYDLGKYSKE
jgi:hypothetical protein